MVWASITVIFALGCSQRYSMRSSTQPAIDRRSALPRHYGNDTYWLLFPRARPLGWSMLNLLNLIEIFAVALALHVVAMDEPERRGIDAVAQATAISGAIREDVAEVAVAVG